MKQGSFAWAMEQLLAGKKVTRNNYANKDYHIKLNDDGNIVRSTNTSCNFDYADTSATDWIIWHPPINYPVGTFPWAWEQLKAGKTLRVKGSLERWYTFRLTHNTIKRTSDNSSPFQSHSMAVDFINATDWELV